VALYIWDAMARGAFKFLVKYLDIAHDGCTPNKNSWTAWVTSLFLTGFTLLVLVPAAAGSTGALSDDSATLRVAGRPLLLLIDKHWRPALPSRQAWRL